MGPKSYSSSTTRDHADEDSLFFEAPTSLYIRGTSLRLPALLSTRSISLTLEPKTACLKILLYTDLTILPDQLFWHRDLGLLTKALRDPGQAGRTVNTLFSSYSTDGFSYIEQKVTQ